MTLKVIGSLILIGLSLIYVYSYVKNNSPKQISQQPSIYEETITLTDIDGNPIDFNQFKGKKLFYAPSIYLNFA